ncbi:MAG TPA: NAD(P)-binding domain-containing protein [Ktedonobacterales bacterium]
MAPLHIAVLGAGNIGGTLGRKWVTAGHRVIFGVPDPTSPRAQALRAELGQASAIGSVAEALAGSDVVVLAVPGRVVDDLIRTHVSQLDGKIIVDASNRMESRADGGPMNSVAALSVAAPAAHVYRAFNSLGWENFADPLFNGVQADLFYAGPEDGAAGDPQGGARTTVERLIADVGLHPVYVGGPEQVGVVDGVANLWFALALGQRHGRRLAFKVLVP